MNGIMATCTADGEDVIAECVTAVSETETQQRVGGKRKRSLSGSGGEEKAVKAKKRMNGMSTREVGEEGGEIDPRLERVVILDAGAQYGKVTEHFVLDSAYCRLHVSICCDQSDFSYSHLLSWDFLIPSPHGKNRVNFLTLH